MNICYLVANGRFVAINVLVERLLFSVELIGWPYLPQPNWAYPGGKSRCETAKIRNPQNGPVYNWEFLILANPNWEFQKGASPIQEFKARQFRDFLFWASPFQEFPIWLAHFGNSSFRSACFGDSRFSASPSKKLLKKCHFLACFPLLSVIWLLTLIQSDGIRVAGLGRLSAGAKMAMKPFAKHVFTIFATNASFLRVISNFRI